MVPCFFEYSRSRSVSEYGTGTQIFCVIYINYKTRFPHEVFHSFPMSVNDFQDELRKYIYDFKSHIGTSPVSNPQ